MKREGRRLRRDVLDLLTVHLHEIHDLALIELRPSRGAETERLVVATGDEQTGSVHHGDAARTETEARAEAQVEVVTQAETLEQSRHEHDERILVPLRGVHALILEEVQHLVQHNGTDELTDIVNELQQSGQAKGKSERARHTLEQTRSSPKATPKQPTFQRHGDSSPRTVCHK